MKNNKKTVYTIDLTSNVPVEDQIASIREHIKRSQKKCNWFKRLLCKITGGRIYGKCKK